jgi:hypothetical protein
VPHFDELGFRLEDFQSYGRFKEKKYGTGHLNLFVKFIISYSEYEII